MLEEAVPGLVGSQGERRRLGQHSDIKSSRGGGGGLTFT